jgi:GT2 family glycosyltransferase
MPEQVSAIVLNWNGGQDLLRSVESLLGQRRVRVQVIVVDNGSTDGSPAALRACHPELEVLELGANMGFCGGNNQGLRLARGDWVLLLNCDAWLQPDYLDLALEAVRDRPEVGMVAGKVLRDDGRTLDTTGQFLSPARHVVERGYGRPDRGQYDRPGPVPGVCGAVALLRASMIRQLAPDGRLLDEDFFAFSEDADLCWRARRLGWRGWYLPQAVAVHRRSASAGRRRGLGRFYALLARSDDLAYHIAKNRFLMILKNEAAPQLLLRLPLYLVHDLPRLAVLAVLRPRVLWRVLTAWPLYRRAWRFRGRPK